MMKDKSIEFDVLKDKLVNASGNVKDFKQIEESEDSIKSGTLESVERCLDKLSRYHKVTVDPMVLTRKKGLLGKMVILFKRFSRKVVAWYLQPVCDEQTRYNQQAYLTMVEINAFFTAQMEKQIEEIRKQQDELRRIMIEENEKKGMKFEKEVNGIKGNIREL